MPVWFLVCDFVFEDNPPFFKPPRGGMLTFTLGKINGNRLTFWQRHSSVAAAVATTDSCDAARQSQP
jgi:hypothetical protein